MARRRDSQALWAALILLVPLPTQILRPHDLPWSLPFDTLTTPSTGPMVLAAVVVLAVTVRIRSRPDVPALQRCAGLCLGLAAGLATVTALALCFAGDTDARSSLALPMTMVATSFGLAAVAGRWLPVWLTRSLIGTAVLITMATAATGPATRFPASMVAALVLLGLVGLVHRGRHAAGPMLLGVAMAWYAVYGFLALYLSPPETALPFLGGVPCLSGDGRLYPHLCAAYFWPTVTWVATAGLVPVLFCAAATVLDPRDQQPGPALLAFASAMLWSLLVAGPTRQPLYLAGTVGAAVVLLLAGRAIRSRLGRYELNAAP